MFNKIKAATKRHQTDYLVMRKVRFGALDRLNATVLLLNGRLLLPSQRRRIVFATGMGRLSRCGTGHGAFRDRVGRLGRGRPYARSGP
jgi:hypothetical protein